jgi:hypothetical protein
MVGRMPPFSRNHRVSTGCETPASRAASQRDTPRAMAFQNRCRCSRRPAVGRPGERMGPQPARLDRRRLEALIATESCCNDRLKSPVTLINVNVATLGEPLARRPGPFHRNELTPIGCVIGDETEPGICVLQFARIMMSSSDTGILARLRSMPLNPAARRCGQHK